MKRVLCFVMLFTFAVAAMGATKDAQSWINDGVVQSMEGEMIESVEHNGRTRYRIVCGECRRPALKGVYPTEARAKQALRSAGKTVPGRVFGGHWTCGECERRKPTADAVEEKERGGVQ